MKRDDAIHLMTVKAAIMHLLSAHPRKWIASRAITAHLQAELGRNIKPTCYLLRLVLSGHIMRAHKPWSLTKSKTGRPEYLYKWSGRPYRDKIHRLSQLPYDDLRPIDRAQLMRCLSAHYHDLPAWYRRMMP